MHIPAAVIIKMRLFFEKTKQKATFQGSRGNMKKNERFVKVFDIRDVGRPLDPRTIDKISLDKSDTSMLTLLLRNYGYCYILYLSGQWENMRAW
jgi:hypothetical protein